jgi:Fur family ferric uptake transcriptional regulator
MNYVEHLKLKQIKITPHKIAILELFDRYRHIDAMQIIHKLNEKSIVISLATVYRILASFEEKEIIIKHNFGNEQAIYELKSTTEHHDHLICISCGKVIEFTDYEIEALQLQIAKINDFQLINHSLNIYGKCSNCH